MTRGSMSKRESNPRATMLVRSSARRLSASGQSRWSPSRPRMASGKSAPSARRKSHSTFFRVLEGTFVMMHDRYRAIAPPGLEPPSATAETWPLPAGCIAVSPVKQRTNYSCGPAAALSLLRYWKWEAFAQVDEGQLHEAMGTTIAHGTEPEPMGDALR